jgi:hypothetical protein
MSTVTDWIKPIKGRERTLTGPFALLYAATLTVRPRTRVRPAAGPGTGSSGDPERVIPAIWRNLSAVMPGLVPGIHVFKSGEKARRGWPGQARP